jgi:hypothetical protein
MGYALEDRGSIQAEGERFFLLHGVQIGSEVRPNSDQMDKRGYIYLGIKRPGRESDHAIPSSTEVKNGGTITPLPIRINGVMFN